MTWLSSISPVEHTLNEIFSVLSPELYHAGMEAREELQHSSNNNIVLAATTWVSCFTGISVIANHVTPPHIDTFGHYCWYDLLAAAGRYTRCKFRFRDLGGECDYLPGTLLAINGNFIQHEVDDWEGPDRICYAHFMRKAVLKRLGVEGPSWVTLNHFSQLL